MLDDIFERHLTSTLNNLVDTSGHQGLSQNGPRQDEQILDDGTEEGESEPEDVSAFKLGAIFYPGGNYPVAAVGVWGSKSRRVALICGSGLK